MVVTLLGSGPSLAQYDGTGEKVIAINRAVITHRSDWWVFGDDRTFLKYQPVGKPRLFLSDEALKRLTNVVKQSITLNWSAVGCTVRNWQTYSAPAALVLAKHIGAKKVITYGIDRIGVADWDGHKFDIDGETAEQTRSNGRWEREAIIWNNVISTLGIEVTKGQQQGRGNS